ncbi:metabotropic glutamate receptor 1-like isoform X2 [Planococcus citri]|uniref:metabotropic glutamate receptor 1-like isoform X2 n=1 Tax=Planococcus citri TaxID=170843 RepID=UPI0031F89361
MKRYRYAFFLTFFISTVSQKNVNCDDESSSKKDGKPNIKIDVILPLSETGSGGKCGDVFHPDALQNVEALYYALDLIQKDDKLSQKFNLTVDVKEVCSSPNLELKHLSKFYDQLMVDPIEYQNATFGLIYDTVFTEFNYENIFLTFRVFPHISYSGAPTKLNDADVIAPQFAYDFITPTSGHIFIADVILEILNHFKWKYVTVHDPRKDSRDDKNGMAKFFERRFEKLAESKDVCISKESKESIIEATENVLTQTHTRTSSMADVILCFCDQQEIENLKGQLQNRSKKYVVIAVNTELSWTNQVKWNSTMGDLYYVTPSLQYNETFYHYYTSLSEENYTRYPYLEKFRKRYSKYNRKEMSNGTSMYADTYQNNSNSAINIIKSLYAMAHVIKRTFDSKSKKDRYEAGNVIRSIKFNLFNEKISFTGRSGLPKVEKFDVHKFQEKQNETGHFIRVAEYLKTSHTEYSEARKYLNVQIQGNLTILDAGFQYPKHYLMHRCSEPCSAGHVKKFHDDNTCCWECEKCGNFSIPNKDGNNCEKCEEGLMTNENYTKCIASTLSVVLQISTECAYVQNLLSIGLSSISIILTAVVLLMFVKHQNTPAVKSTTRELCYMMFAGIILVNAIILFSTATSNFETSDVKVLPAIGFTMIYGALLVKTNRIARLLVTPKRRFAKMNLKYLSLKAQIIMTAILIAIEILICWFSVKFQNLSEPGILGSNLNLKKFYLDGVFLIRIFAFVALLILLCTYYAFKTRNLPENFNEAKYIGFAMYATVLTTIAFGTVYFTIDDKKILAMNVCASINTLIILIFLFSPKLYIILWKPERNTRVYFSPVTSSIRSYMGKESRPNSRKPLKQCYSLETSGPQSSFSNAAENLKEHERNDIVKTIEEIDILQKEINLDILKEKFKADDLQLDEMMDNLQKAYSEKIENVKLKYTVKVDRVEKNNSK